MLKHTEQNRGRIHDGLKKYSRIVAQARHRGMNERDTGDIVKAVLGDMLGYDPFFDVTAEVSVRGPHADYAVLIEGKLRLLVVVKSIGCSPNAAHLLGMSGAATPAYADWVLLTNADVWACYRLGVGPDRHPELVFRIALSDAEPIEEKAARFFLLSKEGLQQESLTAYWEQIHVLHPGRIATLLMSEDIINLLRRELLRTASYRAEVQQLRDLMARHVLRPDALAAGVGEEATPGTAHCYAYVRDPNNPATWRLRYRNADGTPNADLLTRAAAALSHPRPEGIPPDDLPFVRQRLRQAYQEIHVAPDDLPDALRTA